MAELISQAKERLQLLTARRALLEENLSKTTKEISELEFWVKLSEKLEDRTAAP